MDFFGGNIVYLSMIGCTFFFHTVQIYMEDCHNAVKHVTEVMTIVTCLYLWEVRAVNSKFRIVKNNFDHLKNAKK